MRFPRPCLSKRIDLNFTNKIRQLPSNVLNETLILLKLPIFSFEVKFYSAVNIVEFGQENFKYFTLNHSLIWSCMAYLFLVPLYLVLISCKFFITCSRSIILAYFLFVFAYLILSTLFCLICSFFHLSTILEGLRWHFCKNAFAQSQLYGYFTVSFFNYIFIPLGLSKLCSLDNILLLITSYAFNDSFIWIVFYL